MGSRLCWKRKALLPFGLGIHTESDGKSALAARLRGSAAAWGARQRRRGRRPPGRAPAGQAAQRLWRPAPGPPPCSAPRAPAAAPSPAPSSAPVRAGGRHADLKIAQAEQSCRSSRRSSLADHRGGAVMLELQIMRGVTPWRMDCPQPASSNGWLEKSTSTDMKRENIHDTASVGAAISAGGFAGRHSGCSETTRQSGTGRGVHTLTVMAGASAAAPRPERSGRLLSGGGSGSRMLPSGWYAGEPSAVSTISCAPPSSQKRHCRKGRPDVVPNKVLARF